MEYGASREIRSTEPTRESLYQRFVNFLFHFFLASSKLFLLSILASRFGARFLIFYLVFTTNSFSHLISSANLISCLLIATILSLKISCQGCCCDSIALSIRTIVPVIDPYPTLITFPNFSNDFLSRLYPHVTSSLNFNHLQSA